MQGIAEYQGKFHESNRAVSFVLNLGLFLVLLFLVGLTFRTASFAHNFLCLTVLGQGLNLFDLCVIDLLCGEMRNGSSFPGCRRRNCSGTRGSTPRRPEESL